MKKHWKIISLTGFALLVVVFNSLHLYSLGRRGVLSQFQEHQLAHAQHLANLIRFFLEARSQDLRTLSSLPSLQTREVSQRRADIQAHFQRLQQMDVKGIYLHNEAGTVTYSTGTDAIGPKNDLSNFFGRVKNGENKGKVLVSPLFQSHAPFVLLTIPLYDDIPRRGQSNPGKKFLGALSCSVDLKTFLAKQAYLAAPSAESHQVWIMDKDGKLLFQSEHPEMVERNIRQREESCKECHVSFAYAEKILKDRTGTVDYQTKNSPKKVAAFAPMEFNDASWVVVANSRYDEVTAFARKTLREHLALVGVVLLLFIAGSSIIIRNDRIKVRAEEETKRWRQNVTERKKAEEALKESEQQLHYLSARLLTSQETERRRISRELHDELGGSLAVLKMRFGSIDKNLLPDQVKLREECQESLLYVDRIIDEVHRLSRDLSPAILEDLGLVSALRWLIEGFTKTYGVKVTSDIADIGTLFAQDAQIIIYRIFQEGLTNIGKYAQAKNVRAVIKKFDQKVSFLLEDDGTGFDVREVVMRNATERGMGLPAMYERVRILGGLLDICSEEGKGTRITFSVGIGNGGTIQ